MFTSVPTPSPGELLGYIRSVSNWLRSTMWKRVIRLQEEARVNPKLYDYLGWLYGDYALRHNGSVFPVAIFPAPKSQRYNLESVLGKLDVESNDEIDKIFDQMGQSYLKKLVRESRQSPPWDDPTYRMTTLNFGKGKQIKINCALGGFYNMLKSCEILEFELLTEFSNIAPNPIDYEWFTKQIHLRSYLHSKGNPLTHSLGRSVAISISTVIIFAEGKTFKTFVKERSSKVASNQNLLHIIPAFMFQPVLRFYMEEYSVRHNIYREYLEELIGRENLDRPTGGEYFDHFYWDSNLRYIQALEEKGAAKFFFTGIAVNLFSLRPEICTLLLVTDPEWIVNQRQGRSFGDLNLDPIKSNWEYKQADELLKAKFNGLAVIDLSKDIVLPERMYMPQNFVPVGAGALKLAVDVVRQELRI